MKYFLSLVALVVLCSSFIVTTCNGFVPLPTRATSTKSDHNVARLMVTPLKKIEDTSSSDASTGTHDHRHWFTQSMLTIVMVSSMSTLLLPQCASASYSAYAHREVDWQQRVAENSIQVSNPKLLRDQLRQIAPMNEERSRIFCPNGPSAAVTPLMENRCSDLRQATPSVFGRSDDVVGNSIPGFSKDWTSSSIYSAADPGGLPEYGFTKSNRK